MADTKATATTAEKGHWEWVPDAPAAQAAMGIGLSNGGGAEGAGLLGVEVAGADEALRLAADVLLEELAEEGTALDEDGPE